MPLFIIPTVAVLSVNTYIRRPLQELGQPHREGFNDVIPDASGSVRRALLFQDDGQGGPVDYAFALRVALQALAEEGIYPAPHDEDPDWMRLGPATLKPFESRDGGYGPTDDAGYQMLLNFSHADQFESFDLVSLLEGNVMARRALAEALRLYPPDKPAPDAPVIPDWEHGDTAPPDELVVIYHNWDEIRRLMWDYVSIVRTSKRLQRAATRLQNLSREVQEFYWNFKVTSELLELRNLVQVATLIVDNAAQRTESRGLHYTLDYPEKDDKNWARDTVFSRV